MQSRHLPQARLVVLFLSLLTLLLLLETRLAYLQFFHPRDLGARARDQSELVGEIPPFRGKILDRHGQELALDVQVPSVWANPREIKEVDTAVDLLHRSLALNEDYLEDRLTRDKGFVWIKRKLEPEAVSAVRALALPGLGFVDEWKRIYPNGYRTSHVLGFTGLDHVGLEGVEHHFDSYLRGVPGWKTTLRDAKQREVVSRERELVLPVDGFNLRLALDIVVQHIASLELEQAARHYRAQGGSIVVMDPVQGDILAMANYPSYDPHRPQRANPRSMRNAAITDLYEPGSAFKIVTLGAALEEGVAKLENTFDCENGAYRTGGRVLHDVHPYGRLNLEEIIVKSSNIGTVKVAQALGAKKFHQYMRRFGFGERTGVDLPGEIRGVVKEPKDWSGTSISSMPIGQEVGVTALQMACAFSAIAHHGILVKPRVILEVSDGDGRRIRHFPPQVHRRVISSETAELMRRVLKKVVAEGTGKKAQVEGVTAGGKTGTSQKVEPDGSFSHSHFMASFGGFIEKGDKKAVIMVVIDDPQPLYYGGTVAAPVFARVGRALADYWAGLSNDDVGA